MAEWTHANAGSISIAWTFLMKSSMIRKRNVRGNAKLVSACETGYTEVIHTQPHLSLLADMCPHTIDSHRLNFLSLSPRQT